MIHLALFEPEIPQNTGNIFRLAANTGASVHLIEPLGFEINDKQLKRARLDYLPHYHIHRDYEQFRLWCAQEALPIYASSTHAQTLYHEIHYPKDCVLLFGPESRGLPASIRQTLPSLRIPMKASQRSLNLSNSVAIVTYEWLRQHEFNGLC